MDEQHRAQPDAVPGPPGHAPSDDASPPGEHALPPDEHASPAEELLDVTGRVLSGAASVAGVVLGAAIDAADGIVDNVGPVARHVVARTREAARGRRKRLRTRRVVRRNVPLPNLFDRHPEARTAPVLDLGLVTVSIDEIVGTAVEGPAQRGLDFQPLPAFRSHNWEGRWQRILRATENLRPLPPIDVLRTAEGYWITDGHNRVAAAKAVGQLAVDAMARAVLLPGEPRPGPAGHLAPVLADAAQVKAAGRGQLSRGSTVGRPAEHHDHDRPRGATGDQGDEDEAGDHDHRDDTGSLR